MAVVDCWYCSHSCEREKRKPSSWSCHREGRTEAAVVPNYRHQSLHHQREAVVVVARRQCYFYVGHYCIENLRKRRYVTVLTLMLTKMPLPVAVVVAAVAAVEETSRRAQSLMIPCTPTRHRGSKVSFWIKTLFLEDCAPF